MKRIFLVGLAGLVAAIGCGSSSSDQEADATGSGIAWDPNSEDPAKLVPDFVATAAKVIPPEDVGKEFGLDDQHVPYPDTYWPFLSHDDHGAVSSRNGIDHRWQGADTPSPLEKYMALLDPTHASDARDWEANHHGEKLPGVADWFGHCPGWTGAAMFNAPLDHGVSVKLDASGAVTACAQGESGCADFAIGDINALEAEAFLDAPGGFLGSRCDTKPKDVPRDENGRVTQAGCRGLNPGALVVVLANRMKNVKGADGFVPKAVAIDAQNQFITDQIWNQPAYKYRVDGARAITLEEAIQSTVKQGKRGGLFGLFGSRQLPKTYPWNTQAKGFMRVDVAIKWVKENGPNTKRVSGLDSTREMKFGAILELDADPSDEAARIIGGEFLDDPDSGENRLTVPPFVWTADGVRSDDARASGTGFNPFVKPSAVQALVKLAQQ